MVTLERVAAVVERIRPMIQSDGGDIELVGVADNRATVRLSGCAGEGRGACQCFLSSRRPMTERDQTYFRTTYQLF